MKLSFLVLLLSLWSTAAFTQDTLSAKNVEAILYTVSGHRQPLVVGLGGAEGGNAWASDRWRKRREEFLQKGYSFLALGYFGCKGAPALLDRIAIEDVYNAIAIAKKQQGVDSNKVAILGGSRGADLALLLGSYYMDIDCVVGLSASHAVFPGHTQEFTSSCFTFAGKQLPFVPVNDAAVPFLIKGDLRATFSAMLQDSIAEQQALIKVEKINAPVLLISATKDEIIPAVEMGNKIMKRLRASDFGYAYEHIIVEGMHAEPTSHLDKVFTFLEQHLKNR